MGYEGLDCIHLGGVRDRPVAGFCEDGNKP